MSKTTSFNLMNRLQGMSSLFLAFCFLISMSAYASTSIDQNPINNRNAIPIGATIALKANNGKYVSSENGTRAMIATSSQINGWEKFTVEDAGNGKIALKGNNGKYVSSEYGEKPMHCNVNGLWFNQKFEVIYLTDGKIALKGSNNKFVSSENGAKPLICNRGAIGPWEKFEIKLVTTDVIDDSSNDIIPIGATIALKAKNGKYVCSYEGRKPLRADKTWIRGWEKFEVVDAGDGKIALKGSNGKFVSSEYGEKPMYCNVGGAWFNQKFKVIYLNDGKIALKGSNNKYVTANYDNPLICRGNSIGSWEKFNFVIVSSPNCEVAPGTIAKTQSNCGGFLPDEFTGTDAHAANGGTIIYQWQIKTDRNGQWENIQGANGKNYQPEYAASGSLWYRRSAKKEGCNVYSYSNIVDIHVKQNPEVQVTSAQPACGAQNGSISFSFSDTASRSHIEFSRDGGQSYTTVEDTSGSFIFEGLGAGNYDIWVRWGNNDCPIDLGVITLEERAITVDAGEDQDICIKGDDEREEITLTAQVTGATTCEDCTSYAVLNTDNCRNDQDYVFWLSDGTTRRWFSNVDLVWTENPDGTATLKGKIFDHTLTQLNYIVDATFTGKTTNTGEAPKYHECNDEDTTDWIYYTGLHGTIVSEDGSWNVSLSRRGPSFQMGSGANVTERELGKFGACSWFNTSDHQYNIGDFNFNFGECISNTSQGVSYLWSTGETTQSINVSPTEDTTYTVTVTSCDGCEASDDVAVKVYSGEVSAGDDVNICKGEEVVLTATGEGSFVWSNGETTQSITVSPDETKIYTVTLINDGCLAIDGVVVIVEDLTVDAGDDQNICKGESVVLTAETSAGGSCENCVSYAVTDTDYCVGDHQFVAWMRERGTNQRRWFSNVDLVWTELPNGTATLKGTMNEYFYSGQDFIVDVVYSGRSITPPTDSPKDHNCYDENPSGWVYYTEVSGTITQADGSIALSISRRGEAFQAGPGANVFERVEGKDGGSGWMDVEGDFEAVGDFNINFGECLSSETNNVEYLWSTGETTQSITVSPEETTTYSVSLSNCANCTGTDEVTVNVEELPVDAGNDQDICLGESVVLTAQSTATGNCESCVSYSVTNTDYCIGDHQFVAWMRERGTNQRRWFSNVDLVWTELPNGTATLKGTMNEYFYSGQDFIVDVVYSGRSITPPTDSPKDHNCYDENPSGWVYYSEVSGTITQADGSIALSISRRGEAFQAGPGANVFERVEGKDGGSGWMDVEGDFEAVGDFNINFGECLSSESNTVEYLWSTGETTQSITVSPQETTTYSVSLSNCADCTGADEVTVNVSDYTVDLGNDLRIRPGQSITLSTSGETADSYLWSTGETTPSISVSPRSTTSYSLTAVKGGCTSTDSITVTVISNDSTGSILDPCQSQEFKVTASPIPAVTKGNMNIDISVMKAQDVVYEIYSGANRVSSSSFKHVDAGCSTFNIDLSKYNLQPSGMYILVIKGNDWKETIQFITK